MTFNEWVQDYYEVISGGLISGPIVWCDDWTEEPAQIWHSYVVYPVKKCALCGQINDCYPACTETYDEPCFPGALHRYMED